MSFPNYQLGPAFRSLFESNSMRMLDRETTNGNGSYKRRSLYYALYCKTLDRLTKFAIWLYVYMIETSIYQYESFVKPCERTRAKLLREKRARPDKAQLLLRALIIYLFLRHTVLLFLQYSYDIITIQYKNHKERLAASSSISSSTVSNSISTGNSSNSSSSSSSSSSLNLIANQFNQSAAGDNVQLNSRLISLEFQVFQYKSMLKFVGSPFIQMSFILEMAVVFIIWDLFYFYVLLLIYYKFKQAFNVSLVRMLYDEKREQNIINKLILFELDRIIQASHSYLSRSLCSDGSDSRENDDDDDALRSNIVDLRSTSIRARIRNKTPSSLRKSSEIRFFFEHLTTIKLLKRLALNGWLQPENRKNRWMALISKIYALMSLACCSIGTTSFVSVFILAIKYLNIDLHHMSISDLLAIVDINLVAFLGTLSASTAGTHLFCVLLDQTYLVGKIVQSIDDCIDTNTICYYSLVNNQRICSSPSSWPPYGAQAKRSCLGSTNHPLTLTDVVRGNINISRNRQNRELQGTNYQEDILAERMNENLLKILMQYRIFVRQFEPLKDYCSYVTFLFTSLYVTFPLFGILNVPYLSRAGCRYVVVTFWFLLISYYIATSYICLYLTRCEHLYKRLFRLMAHIVGVQEFNNTRITFNDNNNNNNNSSSSSSNNNNTNNNQFCNRSKLLGKGPNFNCGKITATNENNISYRYKQNNNQQVNNEQQIKNNFSIYNSIIVAILSREISDPKLALSRISITILGGPFGYKYFLRIQFWTAILTLYALTHEEAAINTGTGYHASSGRLGGGGGSPLFGPLV